MSGLISLQQGPLGVAASSRKPNPRPGLGARLRVRDTDGSTLDPSLTRHNRDHTGERDNRQSEQAVIVPVSPSTLFETSQLAARLDTLDGYATPAPAIPIEPWLPPGSSLTLRDRSV